MKVTGEAVSLFPYGTMPRKWAVDRPEPSRPWTLNPPTCCEYQDERLNHLAKTAADAEGMARVLVDKYLCGFPKDHVEVLLNEAERTVRITIERFFKARSSNSWCSSITLAMDSSMKSAGWHLPWARPIRIFSAPRSMPVG